MIPECIAATQILLSFVYGSEPQAVPVYGPAGQVQSWTSTPLGMVLQVDTLATTGDTVKLLSHAPHSLVLIPFWVEAE